MTIGAHTHTHGGVESAPSRRFPPRQAPRENGRCSAMEGLIDRVFQSVRERQQPNLDTPSFLQNLMQTFAPADETAMEEHGHNHGGPQEVGAARPATGRDAAGQAAWIDQYLEEQGSPAAGQNAGEAFVKYGQEYGVDPMLLLAIAGHETKFGQLGVGVNGMLGVGAYDNDPDNSTRDPRFAGVENQIRVGAETFAKLREKGGASAADPIEVQTAAANRGGWATDQNWHNGVDRWYKQIGGAPGGGDFGVAGSGEAPTGGGSAGLAAGCRRGGGGPASGGASAAVGSGGGSAPVGGSGGAATVSGGRQVGDAPVSANGYAFPVDGFQGTVPLHHGSHQGAADLFAPRGTPVRAMRGGTVESVGNTGPGGHNLSIRGDDGLVYYYAHLDQPPLVQQGAKVTTGQHLGAVGDSGNAQGTGPHLHLGIGEDIISGTGPSGGAGSNFDAVGLLNDILRG